jgi:hypothetical protein
MVIHFPLTASVFITKNSILLPTVADFSPIFPVVPQSPKPGERDVVGLHLRDYPEDQLAVHTLVHTLASLLLQLGAGEVDLYLFFFSFSFPLPLPFPPFFDCCKLWPRSHRADRVPRSVFRTPSRARVTPSASRAPHSLPCPRRSHTRPRGSRLSLRLHS